MLLDKDSDYICMINLVDSLRNGKMHENIAIFKLDWDKQYEMYSYQTIINVIDKGGIFDSTMNCWLSIQQLQPDELYCMCYTDDVQTQFFMSFSSKGEIFLYSPEEFTSLLDHEKDHKFIHDFHQNGMSFSEILGEAIKFKYL